MNTIQITRASSKSKVLVACDCENFVAEADSYAYAQRRAELHNTQVHGGEFEIISSLVRQSL